MNHITPLSKIWSPVRSLSGKRSITSLPVARVHGRSITGPTEILSTIAENLVHCSSSVNYAPGFIECSRSAPVYPRLFASDNTETYSAAFTMYELRDAIYSSGDTFKGPEKLHYVFSDICQKPHLNLRFLR